eukprot:4947793-Alexandrium_andersonii.AAC.1
MECLARLRAAARPRNFSNTQPKLHRSDAGRGPAVQWARGACFQPRSASAWCAAAIVQQRSNPFGA